MNKLGVCALSVLLLSGCAFMDSLFGPSDTVKQSADTNKDGAVDPEERKAAGLPVDASPWVELALTLGSGFVPGLVLALKAYQTAKANRAQLEAVVVGVQNFKSGMSTDDGRDALVRTLATAKNELLTPANAAKLTAVVESITTPKGV